MFRIVMLIIRGIFSLPAWFIRLQKIKNDPQVSRMERYHLAQRICAWIMRHGNIAPVISGIENLPQENGYLLTPNHQGLFDPVLICYSHPRYTTAVVKIELTKVFFVKDLILLLQAHPMDRQNLRQSMQVIHNVTADLKAQLNCIIFPEGTRSKKGNVMGEFKGGSFKSAVNAQAPIVPVALIDCFKVFDEKSIRMVHPQIHYLTPITYEQYQDLSTEEIAELVKTRIQEKIDACLEEKKSKAVCDV